jgi:DNA gyrase subunit B
VPLPIVELLLRGRVKDKETFTDKARLMELIQPLRQTGNEVFLERDEEHGVFDIKLQTTGNGHPKEVVVGDDFVASAEYRALYASYEEIRELDQPPLTVVDGGETQVATRDALVAHILAEGKKGMTISRYKGLGEMNAEELWETTMDPATRTLLQVRLEDDEVAENIFTTLMGDAVEPRRQFIEENALNVRNLDI